MRAQFESTDHIVTIKAVGFDGLTKARVWEGVTEAGVRFTAYISIIEVHKGEEAAEFLRDNFDRLNPEYKSFLQQGWRPPVAERIDEDNVYNV